MYTGSVHSAGNVISGPQVASRFSVRTRSGKAAVISEVSPSQACIRPGWPSRVSRTTPGRR